MKITFNIIVFVFILIIGVVIISTIFSSISGVSLFKRPEGTQGILRSQDGGSTWEAKGVLKEGKKKDFARIAISDLVFEPGNSRTLYLLTEREGLYRSEDSGESWTPLARVEAGVDPRSSVFDIAIDESNRDVLYIAVSQGVRGQVFKSEDRGATFREVYVAAVEGEVVRAVAIDSYQSDTIYVGTSSGLLLESRDKGESWRTVEEFESGVVDIIVSAQDTRHIFVVRGIKVSKTIDKGETWQDLDLPEPPAGPPRVSFFPRPLEQRGEFTSFSLDPSDPSHVLVISGAGAFESRDAGASFAELATLIPTGALPIGSFTVDPTNSRTMYIGVEGKVYKSIDGGVSWQIKTIPSLAKVVLLRVDPEHPERIFAILSQ